MEAAINEVMNSIDSDVQDNFRKYADNKRPTPEKCGHTESRDINAAKDIRDEGI